MITKVEAKSRVEDALNKDCPLVSDSYVIVDEGTIEKEYGWVFFYNSKLYLETNEISYALAGNGPVIFDKADGSIHFFGTYKSPEKLIEEYEARRAQQAGGCNALLSSSLSGGVVRKVQGHRQFGCRAATR